MTVLIPHPDRQMTTTKNRSVIPPIQRRAARNCFELKCICHTLSR